MIFIFAMTECWLNDGEVKGILTTSFSRGNTLQCFLLFILRILVTI